MLTAIIDPASGDLTVEGLTTVEVAALAGDLLPPLREVNCARPLDAPPLAGGDENAPPGMPHLRVFGLYHGSVVEGPGRRSVVQLSGCSSRCTGCSVPETHDLRGGRARGVRTVVEALLAPEGEPRDGITVLGGEPFDQPDGLTALLAALRARRPDIHIALYSGYTIEALGRRREPSVRAALALADLLIDGPYVAHLTAGAGEWRGSTNQRVIERPGLRVAPRLAQGDAQTEGPPSESGECST